MREMRDGTGAAGGLQYRELGVLLGGGRVRLEHFDLLLELNDVGSERLTSVSWRDRIKVFRFRFRFGLRA